MQNWESLLSPQEFQAYLKFFSAASGGKPNIVTGQEAVRFFARSGIPNEILSDVSKPYSNGAIMGTTAEADVLSNKRYGKQPIETTWDT